MIKITSALLLLVTLMFANSHESEHAKVHWDYTAHGPSHWGEFSSTCKIGESQSPINIKTTSTINLESSHRLQLDENRHTVAKLLLKMQVK